MARAGGACASRGAYSGTSGDCVVGKKLLETFWRWESRTRRGRRGSFPKRPIWVEYEHKAVPQRRRDTDSVASNCHFRNYDYVPVAQLDRASASGAEGCRFDSCRGYLPPIARFFGARRCSLAPIGAISPGLVKTCGDLRIAVFAGLAGSSSAIWCDLQPFRCEPLGTILGTTGHHSGHH